MIVVTDRKRLVAALRQRGVDWLAPSDAQGAPLPDEMLIASLATHDDPRLRQALTGVADLLFASLKVRHSFHESTTAR